MGIAVPRPHLTTYENYARQIQRDSRAENKNFCPAEPVLVHESGVCNSKTFLDWTEMKSISLLFHRRNPPTNFQRRSEQAFPHPHLLHIKGKQKSQGMQEGVSLHQGDRFHQQRSLVVSLLPPFALHTRWISTSFCSDKFIWHNRIQLTGEKPCDHIRTKYDHVAMKSHFLLDWKKGFALK